MEEHDTPSGQQEDIPEPLARRILKFRLTKELEKEEQRLKALGKRIENHIENYTAELSRVRAELETVINEAGICDENIVNTIREPLVVLSPDLKVISANKSFYTFFRVSPGDTEGKFIFDLGNRQWDIPELRRLLGTILPEQSQFEEYKLSHHFETIGYKSMLLNARQIYRQDIQQQLILLAIEDVTEKERAAARASRAKELSDAINRINMVIHSTLDFNEIMKRVVEETANTTGADAAIIYIPEDNHWVARYVYGLPQLEGRHFTGEEIKYSIDAIRNRKPVMINDILDDKEMCRLFVTEHGVRALLDAPLFEGETAVGDFALYSCREGEVFTGEHIDFIKKITASLSLSIRNANLFDKIRQAQELSEALNRINENIHSSLDFEEIMRRAAHDTGAVLKLDALSIELLQDRSFIIKYGYNLPDGFIGARVSIERFKSAGYAVTARDTVVFNDAYKDERLNQEDIRKFGIRSILAAPLISRGTVLGVISFYSTFHSYFTDVYIDFARKLSASLALALDNAVLFTDIRQAQTRASFFATAIETSDQPFVSGHPDGRLSTFNHAFVELTGYSEDELRSKTWIELTPPEWHEYEQEILGELHRTGEPQLYQKEYIRKDGSRVPIELKVHLVTGEVQPQVYIAFVTDITERKKAEEALRWSEERFRMVAEAARAMVYEVDPNEGKILILRGLEELLGYDLSEITLSHEWWEGLLHPDDRELVLSTEQESIIAGTDYLIEYRMRRRQGDYIAVSDTGKVLRDTSGRAVRLVGGIVDITERKEAEEALKDSETRLRGITSAALDAVILIDNDGNVSFWNDAATRMFGYTNDEIIGRYLHSYIMPERHVDTFRREFEAFRLTGKGPFIGKAYETEAKKNDGTEFPVELSLAGLELKGKWNAIGIVRDITERKRTEEQLKRSKNLSDALNDLNTVIHSTLDVNAMMQRVVTDTVKITEVDAAAIGLFEDGSVVFRYAHNLPSELLNRPFSRAELKGIFYAASIRDAVVIEDARHDSRLNVLFWSRFNIRSMLIVPLVVKEKAIGTISFYCMNAKAICSDDLADFARKLASSVSLALQNANLVNDLRSMEAQMKHMAYHDALTGLPNRRLFIDIIGIEMAESRRNQKKIALLFMDLDRFKEINDTLGHEVGDELLKEVASRLKANIRASDSVARIGGDEFNILMADITRPEDTIVSVQKILESVQHKYVIAGHDLHVSASVGISVYPDDSDEMDTLFRYADIAMYHAKEQGRNTFQFYNPAINIRTIERMKMEGRLREAIERGELTVYYQPQIDLNTKKIVCVEALVRWDHPELGLLEPIHFIPLAEETGFVTSIDEWVMRNVCTQSASWQKAGLPPICITVNLSARQFQNPELVANVSQILDETDMNPGCLDIEITESLAMKNIEHTTARLKELVKMGVHISIDDFGTGYSSLNYLKRLPIERLKIDKSFIQDIATDPDDRAIINAVTAMAHNMKIKVIAEGVETEEQLSFVHSSGCDEVQGYVFSWPLSEKQFREFYRTALL